MPTGRRLSIASRATAPKGWHRGFRSHGLPALPYHAGLDPSVRRDTQERFIRDEARIIVATIAFGSGHRQARRAAHRPLRPAQDAGRLLPGNRDGRGRDGLPSECVLYFSAGDRAKFTRFIDEIEDQSAERERAHQKLDQMIAFGEARTCRRAFVLAVLRRNLRQDGLRRL